MASEQTAQPVITTRGEQPLWFLGTLVRVMLDGSQTAGRLGLFDVLLPRGASPPLHSHPQDETLRVIDGEITAWVLEPQLAERDRGDPPAWVAERAQRCGVGAVVYAPGGMPHTFRVESDTALLLTLSTPAGIEGFARAMGEPALWPWLQPPAEGPRLPAERMEAVERDFGMVRHGPPPPPAGDA
jgi:mannose-6-phosphate isomerase-like protein (cupin superfamily)